MTVLSRRAFVGGLAGLSAVALGTPIASGCGALPMQHRQARIPRVGTLTVGSRVQVERDITSFLDRTRELGWINGSTITIEERWGNGERVVIPRLATELVELPVDVIVAGGTAAAQAARQSTSTIPIVMWGVSSDPIALGLIASLARPGGNVTGSIAPYAALAKKRLEVLTELVPGLRRVTMLVTPDNPSKPQTVSDVQVAAETLGITLQVEDVAVEDLPRAFDAARAWSVQALLVIDDPVLREAAVLSRMVALVDQLEFPPYTVREQSSLPAA